MRWNGDVDTEAIDIEVLSRSSGTEIMNGSGGADRLKEGGAGFTTDAVACNTIVSDFEETLKDLRVMKLEVGGRRGSGVSPG